MKPRLIDLMPFYTFEKNDPEHHIYEYKDGVYERTTYKVQYLQPKDLELAKVIAWSNKFCMKDFIYEIVRSEQLFFRNKYETVKSMSCTKTYKGIVLPFNLIINADMNLYAIASRGNDCTLQSRHSSLSSGKSVYFAGQAHIHDGILRVISDKSGHYQPDLRSFVSGLEILWNKGYDFSEATIIVNDRDDFVSATLRRSYKDVMLFRSLYLTAGFDSPNYDDSLQSDSNCKTLNDAILHFKSNFREPKVYFIREYNELYELSVNHNNETISVSFYDKYNKIYSDKLERAPRTPLRTIDTNRAMPQGLTQAARHLSFRALASSCVLSEQEKESSDIDVTDWSLNRSGYIPQASSRRSPSMRFSPLSSSSSSSSNFHNFAELPAELHYEKKFISSERYDPFISPSSSPTPIETPDEVPSVSSIDLETGASAAASTSNVTEEAILEMTFVSISSSAFNKRRKTFN